MKTCTCCGETKALVFFGVNKHQKDGIHCYCKLCANQKSAAWDKANEEKVINCNLLYNFGITYDDYQVMLWSQDSKCKVCRRDASLFKKRLAVDHCHKTGAVRGLLCTRCNNLLGSLEKHPELVTKLYGYVFAFPEKVTA